MSNGIESFLVVYDPKDKKIDITDNFNKFGLSVYKGSHSFMHLQGAILCQLFIKSEMLRSEPFG